MPEASVQCVITSPPYFLPFGLRDYGTGEWEGGEEGCDHLKDARGRRDHSGDTFLGTRGNQDGSGIGKTPFAAVCGKCGARRIDRQLGLESTPDAYVSRLVEVFREVRRVLRDDGTVWLNLGDSYASQGGPELAQTKWQVDGASATQNAGRSRVPGGLKPKDLIGVPWRVAFALQADGWWLRSDIVWAKPNPMPESVTDRPTRAHEYLFLLAKSARYFWDADAVREGTDHRGATWTDRQAMGFNGNTKHPTTDAIEAGLSIPSFAANPAGRNRRSVWTIATQAFPGAHFAVFPPKLVEPCVLAGSSPGDVVLDPFAGSGTVGVVCRWHNRDFIGIELNPAYAAMAEQRIQTEGNPARRHEADEPIPGQLELL